MEGDLRPSCRCLRSWLRYDYRKETAARGLNLRTSAVIVFGGEAPSLWLDGLILHAAGSKGVAQQTKGLCEYVSGFREKFLDRRKRILDAPCELWSSGDGRVPFRMSELSH